MLKIEPTEITSYFDNNSFTFGAGTFRVFPQATPLQVEKSEHVTFPIKQTTKRLQLNNQPNYSKILQTGEGCAKYFQLFPTIWEIYHNLSKPSRSQ